MAWTFQIDRNISYSKPQSWNNHRKICGTQIYYMYKKQYLINKLKIQNVKKLRERVVVVVWSVHEIHKSLTDIISRPLTGSSRLSHKWASPWVGVSKCERYPAQVWQRQARMRPTGMGWTWPGSGTLLLRQFCPLRKKDIYTMRS